MKDQPSVTQTPADVASGRKATGPVSHLRQEFDSWQSRFDAQPAAIQRYLEAQAGPLAEVFGLASLPPTYWAGLGLYAPVLYGLDRVRKSLARRLGEKHQRRQAALHRRDSLI